MLSTFTDGTKGWGLRMRGDGRIASRSCEGEYIFDVRGGGGCILFCGVLVTVTMLAMFTS